MKAELIINNKRKCSKCEMVKPISEFHQEKRLGTGITAWCGDCINKGARERLKKRLKHFMMRNLKNSKSSIKRKREKDHYMPGKRLKNLLNG